MNTSASKRITDMTQGNVLSLILRFGLPLIAANTLQQVYSMVDTVILGCCDGVTGLAVLGTCSWPMWLLVSFMTNFSQAGSLVLARRFGAGRMEDLKQAAGNIYVLALLLGLIMTVAYQAAARPMLVMQSTPSQVLDEAVLYLRINGGGLFALLAYNVYAAFLRAVGDSQTPLYAIVAATLVNLGLDVWFVAGLGWGAPGAAAATVMAQAASALVCFLRVRQYAPLRVQHTHLRLRAPVIREFVGLSIPMLLQSFVIAAGGFFVQTYVNGYGAAFAAGMSATGKVFGLLETAAIALAQSVATFVSQNYGAGRFERIRQGVRLSVWVSLGVATVLACVMFLWGRPLLQLFVAPEAMDTAWELLVVMSAGLWIMYPMYSLRQALQALGNASVPLAAAAVQLLARVAVTLYLPALIGRAGMYYPTVVAWGTSLVLIGGVFPGWLDHCQHCAAIRNEKA